MHSLHLFRSDLRIRKMYSWLFLFAVINSSYVYFATALTCYSCASPLLQTSWEATGYPVQPAGLTYTSNCDGPASPNVGPVPVSNCDSFCVEMVIPIDGQFSALRGCRSDFLGTYNGQVGQPESGACEYGQLFQTGGTKPVRRPSAPAGTVSPNSPAGISGTGGAGNYAGIRYCSEEANDGEACNAKLANAKLVSNGDMWTTVDPACKQSGTGVTCLYCAEYDGKSGTCNHDNDDNTCSGQWCTKTQGHLARRDVWLRGCSPINPLITEVCINTVTEVEVPVLGSAPISQRYDVNQCYCKTANCNGAERNAIYLPPIVLAIFGIWRVLT